MGGDVKRYCRRFLMYSTRKGHQQTFRPRLQPIPVGGPFIELLFNFPKLSTVIGMCLYSWII